MLKPPAMETSKTFENYPLWIVTLSNLVSAGIYLTGFIIIYRLGIIYSLIYMGYILTLEFILISRHCTECYYWGKTCGFGKGRISSLLFKKGETSKFCNHSFSWKDMIPDLLVSLIPLVIGIVILIIKFDFFLLFVMLVLISLTTYGNQYIRGSLTCKFCKQRESGCPAEMLFNKGKSSGK
jgi:hypothetical protein